eukprot:Skav213923  [mRNA]  locus=scaffold1439:317725:320190:- [translate_table: standard]
MSFLGSAKRSRRPALSKTALRALAELAAAPGAHFSIADTWISAGAEIMAACLAAMQVTKVLSGLECAEVTEGQNRPGANGTTVW